METEIALRDAPAREASATASFRRDVLAGLGGRPKTLPAKYFYDEPGSRLFEAITRLPEYYPTRTEIGILQTHAAELGGLVPPGAALVEFGSGSTEKVRLLLSRMPGLAVYVPVDVSGEFLRAQARRLEADYPRLAVEPVVGDFTGPLELPARAARRPLVGFFPGSTIGNFEPGEARRLLRHFADLLGPGSTLIVGADLVKDTAVLERAYDDAAGVTAAFNLNLLARINRELGGTFDRGRFRHRAFFDLALSRIEMHLVSAVRQQVTVAGRTIAFEAGESIHTENSYKYTPDSFADLAAEAGWTVDRVLTDPDALFAVFVLRRPPTER
jgi:L-histidine Nalpha-methyltransferase